MTQFDIRLVDPRDPNNYAQYLTDWSSLSFSTDRKAPGTMSFRYPNNGRNADLIRQKQVLVVLQDGREGENCRFVYRNRDGERISETDAPSATYQVSGLWDALRDAVFRPATGATKTRTWTNQTPGAQLADVLDIAAERGCFNWWGYTGYSFTRTSDSAGNPWPVIDEMEHEYGITVFDVVDWLIETGWMEVSTSGGKINAWIPDSRGVDRTAQRKPVWLAEGRNILDAPEQETMDDFVSDLVVIGGETVDPADESKTRPRVYAYVSSGITTWGRREKTFRVTGVQSVATLEKIGRNYLKGFTAPRSSRTFSVTMPDDDPAVDITTIKTPTPGFRDYMTLTADDQRYITQQVQPDPESTDLYMTQSYDNTAGGEDIIITRFVAGQSVGTMTVLGGGHGDLFYVYPGQTCVFRHGGASASTEVSGTWVGIPFTAGRTVTAAQALTYTVAAPARSSLDRRAWCQGDAGYAGKWYRLYGTPYTTSGSTVSPGLPGKIEVVTATAVTSTIDVSMLGRVGMVKTNPPIGNRLEPEGIAVINVDGWPHLLVGVTVYSSGNYQHKLFVYPLPFDPGSATQVPMVDYGVADTIGTSIVGLPFARERIEIISATCDENDPGTYLITVSDWLDNRDVKLDRLIRKYGG